MTGLSLDDKNMCCILVKARVTVSALIQKLYIFWSRKTEKVQRRMLKYVTLDCFPLRMLNWKLRRGIEKRRMSDRRKSGMSCPPLRPSRLSSCYSLPNYNLILGWRHLAIHTRAYQMTSTAVWPCITCLEEQQGSLTFNNTKGMGVLMTHVMRIIMAYIPTLRQFISLWLQVILNREKCERWVDSTLSLLFFHYSSRTMTTTTYPDTSDE